MRGLERTALQKYVIVHLDDTKTWACTDVNGCNYILKCIKLVNGDVTCNLWQLSDGDVLHVTRKP